MKNSYKAKLLILDDEADMLRLLQRSLSADLGCEVDVAAKAVDALALLEHSWYDVILADVRMPGMNGMEFLDHINKDHGDLTVIMMTAFGSIDLAVESIKKGAYDFITKPFEHDKLLRLVQKALERSRLVKENSALQQKIREQDTFHEMVGISPKMLKIFETIRLIGKTDVMVLITGESGTGKDMAARAIHDISGRRNQSFVSVNCPNLPESILESELFGYKKGAFTNATQDKKGIFWEAQGGTIFLDEIGDISPTLQTKLLKVLQDKEIRPLGANRNIKVDVRIIASTNQDLPKLIQEHAFREDLFYRLNVFSLHMPPLRERPEDIPLLVGHFLNKTSKEFNKSVKNISPDLMQKFMKHSWRGNIRELQNIISRSVLLAYSEEITAQDIDWPKDNTAVCFMGDEIGALSYKEAKSLLLDRFHRGYIDNLLRKNGGNITKSAKDCGLERQALQQIMKRYGIRPKDNSADDRQISPPEKL